MQKIPEEERRRKSAERFDALLKEKGKTNSWIGKKIGCEHQHVSNMRRNRKRITPEMAEIIVRELFPDVRTQWLLGWDDFKTEKEKEEYRELCYKATMEASVAYDDKIKVLVEDIIYRETGFNLGSVLHLPDKDYTEGTCKVWKDRECIQLCDENRTQVALIDLDDLREIVDRIDDYATYLVNRVVERNLDLQLKRWREEKDSG